MNLSWAIYNMTVKLVKTAFCLRLNHEKIVLKSIWVAIPLLILVMKCIKVSSNKEKRCIEFHAQIEKMTTSTGLLVNVC